MSLRTEGWLCQVLVTCKASTLGLLAGMAAAPCATAEDARPEMVARATSDFELDGRGSAEVWQSIPWTNLNRRGDGRADPTRVKMLYSERGLYVLLDAEDTLLTATIRQDYAQLWREDVLEVFVWPDEQHPVYFEYEISPLGYELPLLIPNLNGKFLGWIPWEYEGERRVRKQVHVRGGQPESGAEITGWSAELFIPYALLAPLQNVPPRKGSAWRANFYRMDYDRGRTSSWDWARVGNSFHEYQKFGTIRFE